MQPLIDRAMMNENTDVQALREIVVAQSVEGEEPSPRVATDGGHPQPTAGWRSPLGGPRYDGPIPGRQDPQVDEWREQQIQDEIEERRRAEAVAGPEPQGNDVEVRTDGGQVEADPEDVEAAVDELACELHVGDHVTDREDEDGATMLVVGTPLEAAGEYEINDGGTTVADVNDCPEDDAVLEVVYPSRTDVSTRPLDRYAFPRSRLALEAPVHDRGGEE